MSTVIQATNLSKIYRLGEIGTGTILRDLERWWYNMRRLPDPILIIGQENILPAACRSVDPASEGLHVPKSSYVH